MGIFRYGTREIRYLGKRDTRLGRAIDAIGMIERKVTPDIFTALVASVAGQQVSAKAAETVWARMENRFGTISPEKIAAASAEEIQQCGMSMRKAGYIRGIGNAAADGTLDLDGLHSLPDNEVIARLTALDGVGIWTAEMLLIFSMQRPDVVSWGDLAIRRGMMRLYGLETIGRAQFEKYRRRYSPYGSVASLYLWEISHRQDMPDAEPWTGSR
jgi:3-methyladenine DNA glycosylase/8-oxoguanine DNA glycosylase